MDNFVLKSDADQFNNSANMECDFIVVQYTYIAQLFQGLVCLFVWKTAEEFVKVRWLCFNVIYYGNET